MTHSSTGCNVKVKVIRRSMSFNVKVISTLNDKSVQCFCDLCVMYAFDWKPFLLPFIALVYGESTKSLHISTSSGFWHKCTFENNYHLANSFEIQVYTHSGGKCWNLFQVANCWKGTGWSFPRCTKATGTFLFLLTAYKDLSEKFK